MDLDMPVKNGGGSDKEAPENIRKSGKTPASRSNVRSRSSGEANGNSGKNDSHSYHGRNHRQHKKQHKHKSRTDSSNSDMRGDLDLSIQEELKNGNYKFRGGKVQVSINHLLEFQLPEIDRKSSSDHRDAIRRRNKTDNAVHLHGDSFINANYRLLVDDRYNYSAQSKDPNIPVPPENIIRVVVPRGQNCPICLEEPVAPQMVACGHIFCHSCLLNFFSAEDSVKEKSTEYVKKRKLKECPLCGSIVRPNKVKSVLFEDNPLKEAPQPNHVTELILMCKPHGSVLPLPVFLGIDPTSTGDFPSAEKDVLSKYAHIMTCTPRRSIDMLRRDIDSIKTQLEIDKILYNEEGIFSKLAIDELEARIKTINEQASDEKDIAQTLSKINLGVDLKEKYDDNSAFFFFQTAFRSSVRYFLSPLDIKILLTIYQQYSSFPEKISVNVENVHYGTTVTEDLVMRYKYFNHLPLGSEIAFIDLDWRDKSIIPKHVEDQFIGELRQRRRRLHIKNQREDKEKLIYQTRLEKEHQEFYRRENGQDLPPEHITTYHEASNNGQISLDSLSSATPKNDDARDGQDSRRSNSFVERTIWGTSIPVIEDKQTSKENKEFEAMLLQKMKESEDSSAKAPGSSGKRSKKSKGKVMLFSNTHQTL